MNDAATDDEHRCRCTAARPCLLHYDRLTGAARRAARRPAPPPDRAALTELVHATATPTGDASAAPDVVPTATGARRSPRVARRSRRAEEATP